MPSVFAKGQYGFRYGDVAKDKAIVDFFFMLLTQWSRRQLHTIIYLVYKLSNTLIYLLLIVTFSIVTVIGNRNSGRGGSKSSSAVNQARRRGEGK